MTLPTANVDHNQHLATSIWQLCLAVQKWRGSDMRSQTKLPNVCVYGFVSSIRYPDTLL